jgi:hypothetical protein
MTDTIINMQLKLADILNPDQLMEGDVIKLENEFFTISYIEFLDEGYNLGLINDFDEVVEISIDDEQQIELYVYVE